MDNPDALNKDQLTNTGDVHNQDQKEQGLEVAAEDQAADTSDTAGEVGADENILFYAEKKVILDFFGAERMELDVPETSEEGIEQCSDMDCIVKLYDAAGGLIDTGGPQKLKEAYEFVLKATEAMKTGENDAAGQTPADKPDVAAEADEEGLSPLSEGQKAWIERNPRFNTDHDFQTKTIGAHEVAIQKGLVMDSDEYFAFIDARLKLVSPDVEGNEKGVDGAAEQKDVSQDPENG